MKNPHNVLNRVRKGVDFWQCAYCKQAGTFAEMSVADAIAENVTFIECTHVHPPCESCGQTPICAIDCSGIAKAFSTPGIYIAGTYENTRH